MSEAPHEDGKQLDVVHDIVNDEVNSDPKHEDLQEENSEDGKNSHEKKENLMPSPQQEEEIIKKKYGGMLPKKPPLISKDHERAFFDSADWALGKQGAQKIKGPLEALRPKLQPTPHQQLRTRHSAYVPADDDEVDVENDKDNTTSEDQSSTIDNGITITAHLEDESCQKLML